MCIFFPIVFLGILAIKTPMLLEVYGETVDPILYGGQV